MIETNRLTLVPLTYGQLVKYLRCDHSLERELHLQDSPRTITDELKEALEKTILPNVADPAKDYLYNTLWTAIDKSEKQMVGDLCIIGEPNAAGDIEIGYGTYDAFQGKGYMKEIVGGIIAWAQTQARVKAIIASTNKTNIPSFRVLEKNQFIRTGETETEFQWKRMLRD